VVAINRRTGERLIGATDASKVVVFDAANFTSGYEDEDNIDFENVGASVGGATIQINSATGQFQDTELDAAAAPTISINL